MTKKRLKLKLAASLVVVAVLGTVALVNGTRAFSSEKSPKVVVEGDYIESQNSVVAEQAPILGATPQDLASSNVLNVNGFETYTLVSKLGTVGGRATTTVSFDNPFLTATSTAGDKVVLQVNDAFGLTGATSTVSLIEIVGKSVTTTVEFDCTASATRFTTSTPSLLNTEQRINTSTAFMIRSGMASSTNPGAGSFVQLSAWNDLPVTQILLTPQKPFLVCKVWQPYGTTLGTFTDSTGTADVTITALISRKR